MAGGPWFDFAHGPESIGILAAPAAHHDASSTFLPYPPPVEPPPRAARLLGAVLGAAAGLASHRRAVRGRPWE